MEFTHLYFVVRSIKCGFKGAIPNIVLRSQVAGTLLWVPTLAPLCHTSPQEAGVLGIKGTFHT